MSPPQGVFNESFKGSSMSPSRVLRFVNRNPQMQHQTSGCTSPQSPVFYQKFGAFQKPSSPFYWGVAGGQQAGVWFIDSNVGHYDFPQINSTILVEPLLISKNPSCSFKSEFWENDKKLRVRWSMDSQQPGYMNCEADKSTGISPNCATGGMKNKIFNYFDFQSDTLLLNQFLTTLS